MINLRKVILQRNINKNILKDISFRKISEDISGSEDTECYLCNYSNKNNKKFVIHSKCLRYFEKCNEEHCGVLYSKMFKVTEKEKDSIIMLTKISSDYYPSCYLCNKIYCEYHLSLKNNLSSKNNHKICSWCNNHYKYYVLFILKNTKIYLVEDVLWNILKIMTG